MTALHKYQRLEAAGLWRASPEAQRRDVIVSIGDASLTITDLQDRVLGHWSLPAIERANPGAVPAVYFPDGDPGETLEIGGDEVEMIEAIETLRNAIARGRAKPGRLRFLTLAASVLSVAALGVFWLPGALQSHTLRVVHEAKRHEIGDRLIAEMTRLTGAPCDDVLGAPALRRLAERLKVETLVVVPGGIRDAVLLPGGTMLLNRSVVENFDEPDATAGFIIAEALRGATVDPLRTLLEDGGVMASVRLLTTGFLPEETLRAHAETLSLRPSPQMDTDALLGAFEAQQVSPRAYALALDPTGETTLDLVELGAVLTELEPVMSDGDWVALQGICGG
ncbi:hypothetical protein [Shimia biformata]|uniref:hypothetical protein n=1 Tax=Shimia biformata TaxID=1294299 RepID=UPI00194F0EA4|nr:hypothetical protein [Shimia biformata]